jgi:hypothetical protein
MLKNNSRHIVSYQSNHQSDGLVIIIICNWHYCYDNNNANCLLKQVFPKNYISSDMLLVVLFLVMMSGLIIFNSYISWL